MIQSRKPAQVAVEPAIDGKVLAGTGDDRFISVVTELAVMFANRLRRYHRLYLSPVDRGKNIDD
jgi:hypothetical protein